jgi:hypothetical protein
MRLKVRTPATDIKLPGDGPIMFGRDEPNKAEALSGSVHARPVPHVPHTYQRPFEEPKVVGATPLP